MCHLYFRTDIRKFHNLLRVKPSSVFKFIVVINLSLMLSCEPVPVSGFPVLVIGVCEKGEMACQAGQCLPLKR